MSTFSASQLAQGSDLVGAGGIPGPPTASQLFGVYIPPNNPVVSGQTPAPNTAISPTTPIVFTVTGATGKYSIEVQYPSGLWETAWNGTVFSPFYIGGSSIVGNAFSLLRTGGWLQAPTVVVGTGF